MNNPLNTPQSPNDLVLRLIGGKLDGQLFTVRNEKCLLSDLSPDIENPEDHRCVIFRGEKGVAFRSYSDRVLCNGAKVSVQWLKKSDLIKLTDNFSVEVYQLGVYKKKATAAPASRKPVHTVAIPANVDPASSHVAPVVARPVSTTVAADASASAAPPVTGPASTVPPQDYAKPSAQSPAVSPLPTHQVPTETPAPVPSVAPMPIATQPSEVTPVATDSLPAAGAVNQAPQPQSPSEALSGIGPVGIPSTPSNSTIDSLSERLSKLVDSAGTDGESGLGESTSTAAVTSPSPSVSPMPIEPTPIDQAGEKPAPTSEAVAQQSPVAVQPTQPSTSPGETDSAAQRRAALENYFSKSGVSLADPPPSARGEDNVSAGDPVSPTTAPVLPAVPPSVTSVQPPASIASSASVEPSATVSPVPEAIPKSPHADQVGEPSTAEKTKTSAQLDLDSVLAKLESGAAASPAPPASVNEPAQISPSPVAAVPAFETPVVETPVVETPVVETPVVTPTAVETENNDIPSAEAANGDQGNQLESFALLQSLGLDTSGLGQIKKELAEAPRAEEVQSISPNAEPQSAPQTSEPETSEPEKVESVADVLARMQNAGSLQDFNAGEAEAEPSAMGTARREAATPPPASPPTATMSSSSLGEQGGGEDDGSVEDYMSQLLNRMRGDNEPTSGEVAEQKQDKAVEEIIAEQHLAGSASQARPEKVDTLTPEEFVPKQKAVRMQSLDSLREIANSNAREAFRDSLARERKVSTQTKLTLSMVSLAFAVLFVLMSYIGEKVNFWGVVFGIGFLIVGLLTARAYLSERKLDESILSD